MFGALCDDQQRTRLGGSVRVSDSPPRGTGAFGGSDGARRAAPLARHDDGEGNTATTSRLKPLLPPARRLYGDRSMLMQRICRQKALGNRGSPSSPANVAQASGHSGSGLAISLQRESGRATSTATPTPGVSFGLMGCMPGTRVLQHGCGERHNHLALSRLRSQRPDDPALGSAVWARPGQRLRDCRLASQT